MVYSVIDHTVGSHHNENLLAASFQLSTILIYAVPVLYSLHPTEVTQRQLFIATVNKTPQALSFCVAVFNPLYVLTKDDAIVYPLSEAYAFKSETMNGAGPSPILEWRSTKVSSTLLFFFKFVYPRFA